jgi:hypothetical protein
MRYGTGAWAGQSPAWRAPLAFARGRWPRSERLVVNNTRTLIPSFIDKRSEAGDTRRTASGERAITIDPHCLHELGLGRPAAPDRRLSRAVRPRAVTVCHETAAPGEASQEPSRRATQRHPASEPVILTWICGRSPSSSTVCLHQPTLIAAARSQTTASSPRGTFSQAELTGERVITRCITRSPRGGFGVRPG